MKLNLVLKNSFWPIIAKFINLVFIVMLIKFLSLNVDSYTFGEMMFLMSQLTIFTTISKFGLTNFTQKIFLDNKIKSNEVFSFIFFFKFLIIFLCVSFFIFLNRGHFPTSIIMSFVLISSISDLFIDHKYFTRDFKKTFIAQSFINSILILLLLLVFSSKQVKFD